MSRENRERAVGGPLTRTQLQNYTQHTCSSDSKFLCGSDPHDSALLRSGSVAFLLLNLLRIKPRSYVCIVRVGGKDDRVATKSLFITGFSAC